tara:strand:- start:716 stop:1357 length:642 start_codon:yes stop_codon:yes gene_type:complete
MIWFKNNIRHDLALSARYTTQQYGIYCILRCLYLDLDGKGFTNNIDDLMRILRLEKNDEKDLDLILKNHYIFRANTYKSVELNEELKQYQVVSEKNKKNRSAGLVAPKSDEYKKTEERGKKKLTNEAKEKFFLAFWSIYPRKANKGTGRSAFYKVHPDNYAKITADVTKKKQSPDWLKENGKFIPYPSSYLNAEAYLDEAEASYDALSELGAI